VVTLGRAEGKGFDVRLASLKRFDLNATRITGAGGARLQETPSGYKLD